MIYWDHNATTPLRPEVAELLRASVGAPFGNPSSVHQAGRKARLRLETARQRVAAVLGCEPKEIIFTGSGTDGDALCVKGAFFARKDPRRTGVVISAIEHPAVLHAASQLEKHAARVTRVKPDANGVVASVAELLRGRGGDDVAVCSLMWANNETGVLQPVREVARACRERGVLFHTDAVQVIGKVPVTLRDCDADLLTIAAHKFGGPPGVGACVIRKGVNVEALSPGHQENGRRGGTQNVPYVEALALALELAAKDAESYAARVGALRDRFERAVLQQLPGTRVNGAEAPRVPNTSNITFSGADGEALLIALDLAGICVSTGAACASGSLSPSHVLTAMGLSSEQAHQSLRFSLGAETTEGDVERVIAALIEAVPRVRAEAA
ncbi:MAG: cysteine desulfurase family protein [Myxococcaceae bacterium]